MNLLLGPIREEILVQGQLVRNLKEKKTEGDLTNEVSKLKKLRRTLEKTEAELTAEEDEIDYKKISSTIKNHFFYSQSATLYGGSGGFIDFGPYGTKVRSYQGSPDCLSSPNPYRQTLESYDMLHISSTNFLF